MKPYDLHEVQLNVLFRRGSCRGIPVDVVRNSCTFYTYLKFSGYEMDLVVFNAAIMRSIAVHSQMPRI